MFRGRGRAGGLSDDSRTRLIREFGQDAVEAACKEAEANVYGAEEEARFQRIQQRIAAENIDFLSRNR